MNIRDNYIYAYVLLQKDITRNIDIITPKGLYNRLMNWASQLAESKDLIARKLYSDHLLYFEKLNIENYSFEPLWYDWHDFLKIDFLKITPETLGRAVDIASHILWEIIAFKTDRDCKLLGYDNLRLLTDKQSLEVFFCCDSCSYSEDINGEKIEIKEILYPATVEQVAKYKVLPMKF